MEMPKRRRLRKLSELEEIRATKYSNKNCMPSLPDDILLQILDLFPLKSLFRFKCVSREWYDLICSSTLEGSIASKRRLVSPLMCGFFYQDMCSRNSWTRIKFLFTENKHKSVISSSLDRPIHLISKRIYVVASSNGFLLCCRQKKGHFSKDYYVCNPFTKQWVALPIPPRYDPEVSVGFNCIADQTDTDFVVYEVLRFERKNFMNIMPIELFSSATNEWTYINLEVESPITTVPLNLPVVVVHGVYYWLGWSSEIIACDVKKGRAWMAGIPGRLPASTSCLGVSNTLLYAISDGNKLEVWASTSKRHKRRTGWTLKHRSYLMPIIQKHPYLFEIPSQTSYPGKYTDLKCFHPSNPGIIFFLFRNVMVTYHLDTGEIEGHRIFSPLSKDQFTCPLPSSLRFCRDNFGFFPCEWFEWPRSLKYF